MKSFLAKAAQGSVTIPLFPLEGAVLLPMGDLPLNIFEPRYVAMIRAALAGDRIIGMVQPCIPPSGKEHMTPLYRVGCAGRIAAFEEMPNGNFLITLRGLARFELVAHKICADGYRLAEVDLRRYLDDVADPGPLPETLGRAELTERLEIYLSREGLQVDWTLAEQIPDHRFYTLVAMICPFSAAEKQALLEAADFEERCRIMKCLMDMACAEEGHSTMDRPC